MSEYVIETENLSKTYGWFIWKKEEPALVNLNLKIPPGTIFGFLGPNGAGKTTTIRLLMDLIRPTEGTARVLGKATDDIDVKMEIGFLPDSPAFSSYLSAYEFLNICAKLLKIPSKIRKDRIDEVLEIVRMIEHKKSKLGGFSRGMLQRIGIAQCLLNKPKLLILDEPLVGLDPHGRNELKDIIVNQKKEGTNVFFCSHILSDVEKMCDSIGILYKGQLMCYGTIEELLSDKGFKVTVKAGKEDLLSDVMSDSISNDKLPDGGRKLLFDENEELRKKVENIKTKNPDEITISSSKESLENFFFRQIENAKQDN